MNCNDMKAKLADLLLAPDELNAEVRSKLDGHAAECAACRSQLEELRATMALLDTWEAPEPNPYFMTRLNARLEEERAAAPASWFERLRARFVYGGYGTRRTMKPVLATAMTMALLVGGGAYLGLSDLEAPKPAPVQAAVVHDLQTLDSNAQLLDQLESLSDQADDTSAGTI